MNWENIYGKGGWEGENVLKRKVIKEEERVEIRIWEKWRIKKNEDGKKEWCVWKVWKEKLR